MEYLVVLFWSTVGSMVSLIGGIALVGSKKLREKVGRWALPFGAGALLSAAFISILPEALVGHDPRIVMIFVITGFLAFFVLERLLGWFHHHHHHDDVHGRKDKTHVTLVIIGDTLHNAIDGVVLGAAFLVNPAAGITASVAIATHEIPQEIGDFGIMLGKGVKPRKAILINVLSACATIITAMLTFWLGGVAGIDPTPFMAIAAGMFIYTAASDLIPDIHERPQREGNLQAIMLLVGVLAIGLVALLLPHEHGGELDGATHDHSSAEHHELDH